jgi:hypothetical protein
LEGNVKSRAETLQRGFGQTLKGDFGWTLVQAFEKEILMKTCWELGDLFLKARGRRF